MTVKQDNAVCIGSRNYSETSQIVTLFGRAYGKIRAIAKGSRRERSTFGGGLDGLTAGEIFFVPARNESTLATLTEFELQEAYPQLRQKLLALHCGGYIADLLDKFTEDLDPHERLFEALKGALGRLGQTDRPENVLVEFELVLLKEIGLAPVWDRCSGCSGSLAPKGRLYFSSESGGMICPDCEPAVMEKRYVEPEVLEILKHPNRIDSAGRKTVLEAHELLSYHERELAGRESTVMRFVNQLLRKNSI